LERVKQKPIVLVVESIEVVFSTLYECHANTR